MPEWIQGVLAVSFTVMVVMAVRRVELRRRVKDGADSVQETNQNKRNLQRINYMLAGATFVFLACFAYPSFGPMEESEQSVNTVEQNVNASETDETLPDGTYGPGTYKVGTDIAPGEYKLTAIDTDYNGYYEVKTDITSDGEVESNSLFDGTEYVVVRSGEYLSVNRATFMKVD